jgi:hypothetical protein
MNGAVPGMCNARLVRCPRRKMPGMNNARNERRPRGTIHERNNARKVQCPKGAMPERCNARKARRPRGADESGEDESETMTDNDTETESGGRRSCRHTERWIGQVMFMTLRSRSRTFGSFAWSGRRSGGNPSSARQDVCECTDNDFTHSILLPTNFQLSLSLFSCHPAEIQ